MTSFEGKVIAVTGAASGIGRAVARECASRNARLALADVQRKPLEEFAEELESQGTEVTATIVDVSSSESVDSWIGATIDHYGRLDGAANIAGIEGDNKVFCSITEIGNTAWDKVMKVNLTGVFYCLRAQLRVMKQGGTVVNAASIAGLRGRAAISSYSVSKHGVIGLTRCAAAEAGARGIRVNAVAPGPVRTPLMDRVLTETGGKDTEFVDPNLAIPRMGTPEELARTFVFLLSDESSWTTGSIYTVDGGAMCQ